MMAERGVALAHTTILRWVRRYMPEFEKQWQRYLRPAGPSWRMDETCIKMRGEWKHLYRVVDKQGNTVDFSLSEHRDIDAAKRFLTQAIEEAGMPEKITVDAYPATHSAIAELKKTVILPANTVVRASKYLNNLIQQGHRGVKQRAYPMLGYKRFENAGVIISGIELARKIKKVQFDTPTVEQTGARAQQLWEDVLAACDE